MKTKKPKTKVEPEVAVKKLQNVFPMASRMPSMFSSDLHPPSDHFRAFLVQDQALGKLVDELEELTVESIRDMPLWQVHEEIALSWLAIGIELGAALPSLIEHCNSAKYAKSRRKAKK